MYITQAEFAAAYGRITGSVTSGCSVLMLVAPDVDGIAAARILAALFKADSIEFKLVGVAGYSDVEKEIQQLGSSPANPVQTVILVNCGATSQLDGLVAIPPHITLYVIDSHGPLNHYNIRNTRNIICFGWKELDNDTVPLPGDSECEEFSDSDESDDDGENDDESGSEDAEDPDGADASASDGSDGDKNLTRLRRADATPDRRSTPGRHSRTPGSSARRRRREMESDADDGSTVDGILSGRKRPRENLDRAARTPSQAPAKRSGAVGIDDEKARRREVRKRFAEYYAGNSYGHPAALLAFEIAEQLNRGRNDLLWLAIIGVTDHFLQEHIAGETYEEYYRYLKLAVLAKNGDARPRDAEAEKIVSAGKGGFIALSEEPRFVTHRFWTIYKAMFYSDYVATRLDTWKDESAGRSNLDKLFALIGLHTRTVTQPWTAMSEEDRRLLFTKLKDVAAERLGDPTDFPLRDNLFYPSFTRIVDMESEISAADVCCAINGLLASGTAPSAAFEMVRDTVGTETVTQGAAAVGSSQLYGASGVGTSLLVNWTGRSWKEAFLEAYECLAKRGTSVGLLKGIEAYQFMRTSMLRLGNVLVRGNHVVTGRLTVQVSLDEDMTDRERSVFTQPLALAALGRYIIKLYRDAFGKWRTKAGTLLQRPVILTVAHPYSSTGKRYITILGLPVTESIEDAAATAFLDAFQEAATRAGAEYLLDSFDSSTLLMDAEHKTRFFEIIDAAN